MGVWKVRANAVNRHMNVHPVNVSGMPTVQGLRRALARIDAGPDGSNTAVWTSLREEPVLYVAGRPHVLRLVDRPLENVEYVVPSFVADIL